MDAPHEIQLSDDGVDVMVTCAGCSWGYVSPDVPAAVDAWEAAHGTTVA